MKTRFTFAGVSCLLLGVCAYADPYLTVLAPGYVVETYATIPTAHTNFAPSSITWDSHGNMYLSQLTVSTGRTDEYGGVIYRTTPDGTTTPWITDIVNPRKMVWAGGSVYGEHLYITGGQWNDNSAVYRSDLSGNVETFASVSRAPHALALDRTGNYGGYMHTATRAFDRTYRIEPDGTASVFSQFPKPAEGGGGPIDITFDPGTRYGSQMYMATDFLDHENSGLFVLDPSGVGTRFAEAIAGAYDVEIDPLGLHFGGDMFVTARIDDQTRDDPFAMYRVTPEGEILKFAESLLDEPPGSLKSISGLAAFAFGSDGAMYIPQLLCEEGLIVVSRVYVPVPGAALLGMLGLGAASWRLRRKT